MKSKYNLILFFSSIGICLIVILLYTPPGFCLRPIDLEYQNNPEKRIEDTKTLINLMESIEPTFKKAKRHYKKGEKKEAISGFINVTDKAINILYLYEALGFSFKNKKFRNPHYLIYNLESYLEERKTVKREDGTYVNKPTNPAAKKILTYPEKKDIDYSKIDLKILYYSTKRIMKYLDNKVLSEKKIVTRSLAD